MNRFEHCFFTGYTGVTILEITYNVSSMM